MVLERFGPNPEDIREVSPTPISSSTSSSSPSTSTTPLTDQQKEFAASLPPDEREAYLRQVSQRSTQPGQVTLTQEQAEFQKTLSPEEQTTFARQVGGRRRQPLQSGPAQTQQEAFAGQTSLESQALAIQQTEKRFQTLRSGVESSFKKIPGLGGDNQFQKGVRAALTLPFDITVGFPTQTVLAGGKAFVAGRSLVAGQETRGLTTAEFERAGPQALESFSESFDPRTGQGVVNLITVAAAASIPAIKTVKAAKAPFTDVKAGTEVTIKTTKTGRTTYTYTNKQGGTTKVNVNPNTGKVKVVETAKGKSPVTREFQTEISKQQLQFDVTQKTKTVVETPSTKIQQFQQKATADINLQVGKRTLPGKLQAQQTVVRTTAKQPVQVITGEKVITGPQVGKVKVPTIAENIKANIPKITGKKGSLAIQRPTDLIGRQAIQTLEITTPKPPTPSIRAPSFNLPKQIAVPKVSVPSPGITPIVPGVSFQGRGLTGPTQTPRPSAVPLPSDNFLVTPQFTPVPQPSTQPQITETPQPALDTGASPFTDFPPLEAPAPVPQPTTTNINFEFTTFPTPFAPIPLPGIPIGGGAAATRPARKGKTVKKRATQSIFQSLFDVKGAGVVQTGGRSEQTGIALRR